MTVCLERQRRATHLSRLTLLSKVTLMIAECLFLRSCEKHVLLLYVSAQLSGADGIIHPNKLSKAKKSGDASINVSAKDITPDIQQKGVDMRIGIDIASISLKRYADVIVFVGGDSDFIPALKFARTEGRQVILFTLGHRGVLSELKASADVCVESSLNDLYKEHGR